MSKDKSVPPVVGERGDYKYIEKEDNTTYNNFHDRLHNFFLKPVEWFRETVVLPNQQHYPWYHEKFPRVKNIDECYVDDHPCVYEAEQQFIRDKKIENNILNILRLRMEECVKEEYPDHLPRCMQLKEEYEVAAANWFMKYGDLGYYGKVQDAYQKQKHRLIWERRHGPVGSGMKTDPFSVESDEH